MNAVNTVGFAIERKINDVWTNEVKTMCGQPVLFEEHTHAKTFFENCLQHNLQPGDYHIEEKK